MNKTPSTAGHDALASAHRTFTSEIQALQALSARLDDSFQQAVTMLLACQGRIVVTGIGKSGHIARKIAATLASTGTPAFFMHGAEAIHGDLGMLTGQIGRAPVCTPVTHAHLVCRLLLEQKQLYTPHPHHTK